jgi:hypothetical protein
MITYKVEYKHFSEKEFNIIDNAIGDDCFEIFRTFRLNDGSEIQIPIMDFIFKFSKERTFATEEAVKLRKNKINMVNNDEKVNENNNP